MRHPLSLEAFSAWLDQQPPEKEYDYTDPWNCAICQYLKHIGLKFDSVDPGYIFATGDRVLAEIPEHWNEVSQSRRFIGKARFGEAAERARELLTTDIGT